MEIDRGAKFRLDLNVLHNSPEGADEPTVYITEIGGQLVTRVLPGFDEMVAGEVIAFKYHLSQAESADVDLFDVFDAHSQDSLSLLEAIMDADGQLRGAARDVWEGLVEIGTLLYVSQVTIAPAFQGRGFELHAVEALESIFGDALSPFVIDARGLADNGLSQEGIGELLAAAGFERIGRSSHYMRRL